MQNDTPATSVAASQQFGQALPAMAIVAIVAALIAPMATPSVLLVIGAPIIAGALAAGQGRRLQSLGSVAAAMGVLAAYLAINALWAVDPLQGVGRAVLFAAIVALAAAVAASLPTYGPTTVADLQKAALIAVGLGAAYLAVETPLGQPIRRLVVTFLPFLRPAPKHMTVVNDWVEQINLYTLNRNLAVLNLLLWPGLLLARARLSAVAARPAAVLLVTLAAIAVFMSEHETSMIALVAGLLAFAGMIATAQVVRRLVLAAWLIATLLVVPIAVASHEAGLHQADWLPVTARNRIVLWNVTAAKLREAPLLGVGIGSTKALDERAAPTADWRPGDAYPQRTGRHAHNIFLQTWYELGAVGALLLLVAGVVALRTLSRLPAGDQPYAYASFVSAMVIASFTWGMWQPWFMCAFGLWVTVLLIGLDAARRVRLEGREQ